MPRAWIVVAAAALVGAAPKPKPWPAPPEWKSKKPPFEVTPSQVKAGETLYVQLCVSCHGTSGRGDGPIAKMLKTHPGDLTAGTSSVGEAFWKLTNGRFPMPRFEERLKENERWQVALYVVGLGKGPAPPPADP